MRNLLAGEYAHANVLVQLNRAGHRIRTLSQLARNAGAYPLTASSMNSSVWVKINSASLSRVATW